MFPVRHRVIDEVPVPSRDGKPKVRLIFNRPLGRAALGVQLWNLLAACRVFWISNDPVPMLPWLRADWARYARRNLARSIGDLAELRGEDVDVDAVMRQLKAATRR